MAEIGYRKITVKKDIELAKKVGSRIRLLRNQRNLTQEKLAELSGIDAKHIQLMESKNPSVPRIDTIQNLCSAFGIEIRDFFSDGFFHPRDLNLRKNQSGVDEPSSAQSGGDLLIARSGSGTGLGRALLENASWKLSLHKMPRSRGQMRIDPKRKSCRFANMEPDEKHSLWDILEKSIQYLQREFNPDGYNVGFDLGKDFGEEIHFVIHILPRYKGDPESRIAGITSLLPEK